MAVEQRPDKANWSYNLGLAYFDKGDLPKAEESYKKAIEADSTCDKAWFALATVQMKMDFHSQGMVSLMKALEIDPNNADYHNSIGIAYTDLGAPD